MAPRCCFRILPDYCDDFGSDALHKLLAVRLTRLASHVLPEAAAAIFGRDEGVRLAVLSYSMSFL